MSPKLTAALKELEGSNGYWVEHLRTRFNPATPDGTWLTTLGKEGEWIVISGDWRISRRRHERQAWLDSKLTIFFMVDRYENYSFWDQAWKMVRWWPDLRDTARRHPSQAAFQVKWSSAFSYAMV